MSCNSCGCPLPPNLPYTVDVVVDITNFASYLHICEHIIVFFSRSVHLAISLSLSICAALSLALYLAFSLTLSRFLIVMCKDAQNILRRHSAHITLSAVRRPLSPVRCPLSHSSVVGQSM